MAEQWLAIKQRTLASSTHRKIKETFNANVYPRFGDLPIADVTALVVRDAMQVMEQRGALELMQKCRAWIRSVFDFALSEEMIQHNPVPQKDLVPKKHKEKRHPCLQSRQDAAQFCGICSSTQDALRPV
jgi:site-specific recombinase XerD